MRADHTLVATGQALVDEVRRLTGGLGADVVVDAAGSPDLIGQAVAMLRPGGRLLRYAVNHRPVPDFTTFSVYYEELTLFGSRAFVAGESISSWSRPSLSACSLLSSSSATIAANSSTST